MIQADCSSNWEPGDVSFLRTSSDVTLCAVVIVLVLLLKVSQKENIVPCVVIYFSVLLEVLSVLRKLSLIDVAHIAERGHIVV